MLIYISVSLLWLAKCPLSIHVCMYDRFLKLRFKPHFSHVPPKLLPPTVSSHWQDNPTIAILKWNMGIIFCSSFSHLTSFLVHYQIMSALLKNIPVIRLHLPTLVATIMVQATIFSHLDKYSSSLTGFLIYVLSPDLVNSHSDSLKMSVRSRYSTVHICNGSSFHPE